jgi:hypothetical protein
VATDVSEDLVWRSGAGRKLRFPSRLFSATMTHF